MALRGSARRILLRATECAQAHRAIGTLRLRELRRLAMEVLLMPASKVQLGAQLLLAMAC